MDHHDPLWLCRLVLLQAGGRSVTGARSERGGGPFRPSHDSVVDREDLRIYERCCGGPLRLGNCEGPAADGHGTGLPTVCPGTGALRLTTGGLRFRKILDRTGLPAARDRFDGGAGF